MKHSLGSLKLDSTAALLTVRARPTAQVLRRMLHQLAPHRQTDLLAALPPADGDRAWVAAAAETCEDLRARGHRLKLVDCERTTGADGHCGIVLVEPAVALSVTQGDVVCAGVALLRGAGARPVVMPRTFRRVCSNGAVTDAGSGEAREITPHEVGDAMRECLTVEALQHMVDRYREAAASPVGDPRGLLARARLATPLDALRAHWREARDSSVWGLVNAATALAHTEPDLARRLERERDAERILVAARAPARAFCSIS